MDSKEFSRFRKRLNKTQKQMAQLLGISAGMVSQYERGQRDIPFAELELAAEQCGQSLDEFLDDETIPLSNAEQDRQARQKPQQCLHDAEPWRVDLWA